MLKQILLILISSCLVGCVSVVVREQKLTGNTINIDKELLEKSDYIEIIFEDGKYSYVSYLKEEKNNSIINKLFICPNEKKEYNIKNGIIIWDYKKIKGKEKEVLQKLKSLNFDRIYVQVSNNLIDWIELLKIAYELNIVVFALDGCPEYIDNNRLFLDKIKSIIEFNQRNEYKIKGLMIDIEPYLLKDFSINKDIILKKYIQSLENAKKIAQNELILNIVIPFWFDKLFYESSPLLFHIFNLSDEITVMSYRTELEEIKNISEEELCLGILLKKPVYLAIEINKLPSERHLVFQKDTILKNLIKNGDNYSLSLDKIIGLASSSYNVEANKLSFHYNIDKIFDILNKPLYKGAFSGWIVHSYEGMQY